MSSSQRSRCGIAAAKQKHNHQSAKKRKAGGFQNFDTLDFTDVAGNYFVSRRPRALLPQQSVGRSLRGATGADKRKRQESLAHFCLSVRCRSAAGPDRDGQRADIGRGPVRRPRLDDLRVGGSGSTALVPRVRWPVSSGELLTSPARVLNGPAATLYDIQKEVQQQPDARDAPAAGRDAGDAGRPQTRARRR